MTAFCFTETASSGVTLWFGNPDCQAAHDGLIAELRNHTEGWLPASESLNQRLVGNLGEFISFFVGHSSRYERCHVTAANALAPISNIAKPDLDLLWLCLPRSVPFVLPEKVSAPKVTLTSPPDTRNRSSAEISVGMLPLCFPKAIAQRKAVHLPDWSSLTSLSSTEAPCVEA